MSDAASVSWIGPFRPERQKTASAHILSAEPAGMRQQIRSINRIQTLNECRHHVVIVVRQQDVNLFFDGLNGICRSK